jgi:hypothetical protein
MTMRNKLRNNARKRLVVAVMIVMAIIIAASLKTQKTADEEPVAIMTPTPVRPLVRTVEAPSPSMAAGETLDGQPIPAPAPPSLERALSFEEAVPYRERLAAVHSLRGRPSAPEIEALKGFLLSTRLPQGITDSELLALKNDILNVLGLQSDAKKLVPLLKKIHESPEQPFGMRDYALQHLASLEDAGDQRYELHWKTLHGENAALAATAMLHLLSSSRQGHLSEAQLQRLRDAALELARDPAKPSGSRATALQICAELSESRARELAWNVARSEKEAFPLRIAAIAALGRFSDDQETREFLIEAAAGRDTRLRIPARNALRLLEEKNRS